jgi:antirestriction protein ArdC
MFQRPSATYAAGFNTWKSLGRHVKKGEKGITVLAPIVVSRKKEQAEVEDQREEQQAVAGFRPVTVFDISQTGGQPLPEVTKVAGDPKSTDRLKDYVERLGIELEYSSEIQPAKGVSCGGKIILLPDLNPGEAFATLVHEAAHEALHKADRRAQTNRSIRETEAEAVAFVVSHAIGLDCLSASADYIQLWNGDRATLVESLQFIQRTASQILSAISPDELSVA